jgi:hypothetical protein
LVYPVLLKKIGSRMHKSDQKFSQSGVLLVVLMPGKKFRLLPKNNFWNSTPARCHKSTPEFIQLFNTGTIKVRYVRKPNLCTGF